MEERLTVVQGLATDEAHRRVLSRLNRDLDSVIELLKADREVSRARELRLVMTLLVRDEEDILEAQLKYHFARGVDFAIVTDNRSVDSTPEILKELEELGRVKVIREESDDYAQGEWVTRMARMAHDDYGADWVINSDADEFWWPLVGSFKSVLAALPSEVGRVMVPRFDFVPRPDGGLPFWKRMTVREARSTNALGEPLQMKVCHRAGSGVSVAQGNHAVAGLDPDEAAGVRPFEILHFPLRSYDQFRRKVVQGGRAYERNQRLDPAVGHAWRHLYRLKTDGKLESYYREREISAEAMRGGIRSGELVRDLRLKRYLELLDLGRSEPSAR